MHISNNTLTSLSSINRSLFRNLGAVSIRKTVLLGMVIPMLKIRRPTGRLIFNMGIPIPGKTVFYIETGPGMHNGKQGVVSIRKTVLPGMAIPMLKIRRPNGRLIFNMEIAIRR